MQVAKHSSAISGFIRFVQNEIKANTAASPAPFCLNSDRAYYLCASQLVIRSLGTF